MRCCPASFGRVRVEIQAESASDLDRAEIVVDGSVAQTVKPAKAPARIHASTAVSVADGSWLAVRCFEKNEQTVRLAHSSPFYIGSAPRRSPESLAYLRAWVEAEMERIEAVAGEKLTADQKAEFLALCRKALRFYEQVR